MSIIERMYESIGRVGGERPWVGCPRPDRTFVLVRTKRHWRHSRANRSTGESPGGPEGSPGHSLGRTFNHSSLYCAGLCAYTPESRDATRRVNLAMPNGPNISSRPAPLRGSLRLKSRMEMLQDSYLRAIASAAGCSMSKPDPDDGIDWTLTHTSDAHVLDSEIDLKVQLKSTSKVSANPSNGFVSISLDNDRFLLMSRQPVIINRILIAMIIPDGVADWVSADHDLLSLRHCSYWINMSGMSPADGQKSTTVRVPTSQIFDDVALCDIMSRIGAGGVP
jgi:hypothetical protein